MEKISVTYGKIQQKPTALGVPQFLPALILALDRQRAGIKVPDQFTVYAQKSPWNRS